MVRLAAVLAVAGAGLSPRAAAAAMIGPQLPYASFGHLENKDGLCAPTATINSFVYLDSLNPKVKLVPGAGKPGDLGSSRDALATGWTFNGQKRAGMGGCGASEQSQWEAKAHWVRDYGDGRVSVEGMVNEPADTIKTWFDGANLSSGFPTWDFLLAQLERRQDVELVLISTDNKISHAVTLTSLKFDDKNNNLKWDEGEARRVDYLDPNNPSRLFDAPLAPVTEGKYKNCLGFRWNNGGVNPATDMCIDAAYAESIPEPGAVLAVGLLLLGMARRRCGSA